VATFLPIVPNWKNGVRDTYEFKTDIFISRDKTEQRRSLRTQPRRSIEAALVLDGARLRVFSDAITKAIDGKVEIGDFSADGAAVTATAEIGSTILHVDHVPAWLIGSMSCVLQSGRSAVKVAVDFISGNQVVLSTALAAAVGAGAYLLPILPASVANSTTLSLHTTMVATSSVRFEVEPGTTVREADALPFDGGPTGETTQVFGPAALLYGRYVLLRKPNYLQRPQMAFQVSHEVVDYDRGITKTFTPVPIVSRTLTATYLASSRAEAMALLDIFVRAKGRAGEIYVPTWGNDFPAVKTVAAKVVTVAGVDFYNTYNGNPAHVAALFRNRNGDLVPRSIVSMAIVGGDTAITFDTNIGITAANIEIISWMFVARFAQDSLTLNWKTNGVADVSLSFTTLVNLSAEGSFGNNWILATGHWRDAGVWQDGSVWED